MIRRRLYDRLALLSIALLTGLLMLTLATEARAELVCDACGKSIQDARWVKFDGKAYHNSCFTCARCGQPIENSRFYVENGRFYDSTCYVDSIVDRCDYCGDPLLGNSISNAAGTYHRSCYLKYVADRCAFCGHPVEGQYFQDAYGTSVCADHKDQVDRCHACQRIIGGYSGIGGVRLGDGRTLCERCRETAVMEGDRAREIVQQVARQLEKKGIVIDEDVPVHLVDNDRLAAASRKFSEDRLGITIYEKEDRLSGLWTRRDYEILILYGLPETRFRAVAAHELMHVWQFKYAQEHNDEMLCEGSCEYAAWLILSDDLSPEAEIQIEQMMTREDPAYGEGFRRVRAYVSEYGIATWLSYLKEYRDAPW